MSMVLAAMTTRQNKFDFNHFTNNKLLCNIGFLETSAAGTKKFVFFSSKFKRLMAVAVKNV